jgi:hypothetical protein
LEGAMLGALACGLAPALAATDFLTTGAVGVIAWGFSSMTIAGTVSA